MDWSWLNPCYRQEERENTKFNTKYGHRSIQIITMGLLSTCDVSNLDATPAFLLGRDVRLSPYLLEDLLLLRAHVTRALELLLSLHGHEAVQISQLDRTTFG